MNDFDMQNIETELRMLRVDNVRLLNALEHSVKLQSHYAKLLNTHDGGQRIGFKDAKAWMKRLDELNKKD